MDKYILASMLKESALIGWFCGLHVFVILLIGVVSDSTLGKMHPSLFFGLTAWLYAGVFTAPVSVWWVLFR